MDILRNILLVLHFVGLASLLGGVIAQVPALKAGAATINSAIFHGALTQLVTGLLLVGVIEMGDLGELDAAQHCRADRHQHLHRGVLEVGTGR